MVHLAWRSKKPLKAPGRAAAHGGGPAVAVAPLRHGQGPSQPGAAADASSQHGRLRSRVWLGPALWSGWSALCARLHSDPALALAPLWALLLHRYAGLDELTLGLLDTRSGAAPADDRSAAPPAPVLRVHSTLQADSSWPLHLSTWMAQWGHAAADGRPGAETAAAAAAAMVSEHSAGDSAAPVPLAVVITDARHAAACPAEPVPPHLRSDAVLCITVGNGVRLELDADAQGMERAALARLRHNFVTLLHGCLTRPDALVQTLPLVSRRERRQMARWNETAVPVPVASGGEGIHHLIEDQVDRTPDAVAVVQDGQALRFAELDRRANAWAHRLLALGVRPGTVVGVLLERSFEMVVAMLAIWKAGGAYLPLEPDFPAQRLHDTVADSEARVILTCRRLGDALPPAVAALCMDDEQALALPDLPQHRPPSSTRSTDACYVIYTSGSTGKPKGAVLPHRAICNHMAWMVAHHRLGADDHVLQKTPFSFDASVWEFLAPLLTGARLVMARPGGHRDMPYLARTITEHQVTTLQLVPSVLQLLVDEPAFSACTSLRRVFCGGEALTTALVRRFAAKLPAELHNLYGPTECCIDTTTFACSPERAADVQPIGRPIWNTTHHVLGPALEQVPLGVPGELYIGGAGLALGYLRREALTAEKFVANPFDVDGSQPRLYRTGDRVRLLPDGLFEFLGRIDFQVKLNGFRIELGEIEAVLERHPQVRQAVALLREDRPGHKLLVAYVVPAGHIEPAPGELREHLARSLPSHMLPSVCVVLASLPLTSNGKVDRRALPRPVPAGQGPGAPGPAPGAQATALEQQVSGIWARVLAADSVGLDDDYFALGGDSLGLMQIGLGIRAELGVQVDTELLFEHRTVRAQARLVETAQVAAPDAADGAAGAAAAALAALPPAVTTGLASVEQEVFWTGARAFRGWPLFNTSEVIAFMQPPELPALQQAIDAVVARHECLRTVLQHRDSALWQTVLPAGPVTIERWNPGPEDPQALHAIVAALVQRALNLEQAPPVRWVLVATREAACCLVLIVHHSMSDGHTMELIVHDLLTSYAARLRGAAAEEPPAAGVRYLAYAAWQRSRLQSGAFEAARRHWQQVLAGAPPPLRLPTDLPRRAIPRWQGGRETRCLGAELRQALKATAAAQQASLYMVLLTALEVLLWEQTGQTDLVVGATSAGRPAEAFQRLAGCTISAVALRVRLDPADSYASLLAEVRRACLGAYAHQNLPLGMAFKLRDGETAIGGSLPMPVWLELHDRQRGWETRFADLGVERRDIDRGISESELSLEVDDTGTALVCHAQYKTGLFFAERVRSWLSRYQQLLESLVAAPDGRLPAREARPGLHTP